MQGVPKMQETKLPCGRSWCLRRAFSHQLGAAECSKSMPGWLLPEERVEVPGVCGLPSILCPLPWDHRGPAELKKPRPHHYVQGTAHLRKYLSLVAELTEPG